MAYFKITDKVGGGVFFLKHDNGSQNLYYEIDEMFGDLLNPGNNIPHSLEVDGWGDLACIGETYVADEFEVECITEEEFDNSKPVCRL